jgi:hypothetical protein
MPAGKLLSGFLPAPLDTCHGVPSRSKPGAAGPGPRQSPVSAARQLFDPVLTHVARTYLSPASKVHRHARPRQRPGSARPLVSLLGVAAGHNRSHDFAGALAAGPDSTESKNSSERYSRDV